MIIESVWNLIDLHFSKINLGLEFLINSHFLKKHFCILMGSLSAVENRARK